MSLKNGKFQKIPIKLNIYKNFPKIRKFRKKFGYFKKKFLKVRKFQKFPLKLENLLKIAKFQKKVRNFQKFPLN